MATCIRKILVNRLDDVIENVDFDKFSNGIISVNKDKFNKSILESIVKNGPIYNKGDLDIEKKKIVVEFSSPNIAKPFHVGHLHSTVLGNCLSNLYKTFNHDVVRLNYLGDHGLQVVLLCVAFQRYGSEEKLQADPLKHLYEVYVEIHNKIDEEAGGDDGRLTPTYTETKELYQRIDSGERVEEFETLWKRLCDISRSEYDKMYKRLGIEFDETHTESMYRERARQLVKDLNEQGKLKERNGMGALVSQKGDKEYTIYIKKSDGSSLYLTRDIVAAVDRYEKYNFDKIHYVVSEDQAAHFRNLYISLNMLYPDILQNIQKHEFHLMFGKIFGISTRKGNAVFLEEVLNTAKNEARKIIESSETTKINMDEFDKIADHLALSSVVVQYLSSSRRRSYDFNLEKFVNLKADSGLFLQYCHARLYSLKKEMKIDDIETIDYKLLPEEKACFLIFQLSRYPDVLQLALDKYQPHTLVQYLFVLGHAINSAYAELKVNGQDKGTMEARLGLFNCARETLAHGLRILGLEPLNEL
ncbi:hypothetical protein LOTGIDRAFT_163540 [Lottia gigantea]|uniref:Probable arginine--tRNA ligase, mitochondrial n=1 Tax=Lottia gigantea TaxID=225164 RepID=V4A2V0_LOTGI|nr:hypothetical protein LOTGIDRAFT_163540 [Lottia gigantea]ESO91022.1 hypothetical protein LOTGIDRAFT_163540 [Lottia gigantea]